MIDSTLSFRCQTRASDLLPGFEFNKSHLLTIRVVRNSNSDLGSKFLYGRNIATLLIKVRLRDYGQT